MREADILKAARRFVASYGLGGSPNEGVAVEVASSEIRAVLRQRLIEQVMFLEGDLRFVQRFSGGPTDNPVEVLQRVITVDDVLDAWIDVPVV